MEKAKIFSFWALPVAILVFIVPQSAFVTFAYSDPLALLLLALAAVAIIFYLLAGSISYSFFASRSVVVNGARGSLFTGLLSLYLLCYALLYYQNGSVPILEYLLHGGDPDVLRAEFTKNQEGVWRVLTYLTSILNKGFLPAAVTIIYLTRIRVVFLGYLVVLTLISISAFEKTLLLWIYLPLIFFFLAVGKLKSSVLYAALAGACFILVSSFALRGQAADVASVKPSAQLVEYTLPSNAPRLFAVYDAKLAGQSAVSLSREVENYQFLLYDLDSGNAVEYLVNRLVWIPYITAYDTILYWAQTYPSIISFSVNRHLSALFGLEFANLEKNVFRFQFGSGEDTTGNSNALYIAEAYVGFGWAGVILFSILIGWIFGGICKMSMLPFIAALPIMALGLISSSLISTLFSGGLAFYFIFALLFSVPIKRYSDV